MRKWAAKPGRPDPADEGVSPNAPCFARLNPASSHLPHTEAVYNLEDRGMHAARMPRFRSVCAAAALPLSLAPPVRAGVNLPNNGKVDQVDFERHVMGLFGRAGCNSGSCHGSFQGRGGFRLSLFG